MTGSPPDQFSKDGNSQAPKDSQGIVEQETASKTLQHNIARLIVMLVASSIGTVIIILTNNYTWGVSLIIVIGILGQVPFFQEVIDDALKALHKKVLDVLNNIPNFLPHLKEHVTKRAQRVVSITVVAIIIVTVVLVGPVTLAISLVNNARNSSPQPTAVPSATPQRPALSLTANIARQAGDSLVAISDGSTAFDLGFLNSATKSVAAKQWRANDLAGARAYWTLAEQSQVNDGEACIYEEDINVRTNSAQPSSYAILLVLTAFTGREDDWSTQVSRSIVQGACIAQKEYNGKDYKKQALVLIANMPDPRRDASQAEAYIRELQGEKKTVTGIVGCFPGMERVIESLSDQQNIPVMCNRAHAAELAGKGNFFSVAPSLAEQGAIAARYAFEDLNQRKALLFYDSSDPYCNVLAQAFKDEFTKLGGQLIEKFYSVGHPVGLEEDLRNVVNADDDLRLVFFVGYPQDANELLQIVSRVSPKLQVLGTDSLDLAAPCSTLSICQQFRMADISYIAYASPDLPGALSLPKPPFFERYSKQFNPYQISDSYSSVGPDGNAILTYDAVFVLLQALQQARNPLEQEAVLAALKSFTGSRSPRDTAGGQVSFGPDGEPQDKSVLVLSVRKDGHREIQKRFGRYSS